MTWARFSCERDDHGVLRIVVWSGSRRLAVPIGDQAAGDLAGMIQDRLDERKAA